MESVTAAVQNGADAVYLGGKNFSARQNAQNFDCDALQKAVKYCHARDVKVYQTLNTLVFDRQFSEALETARAGCNAGVDAFIVQDLGLFSLLRKACPQMRLHASTQMTVHTPSGARLLQELGAERVVLARELSLDEIREITRSIDVETEVFVHGALCMSVSGQCYMSGMLGGRSGNRGNCAGTCRLPFTPDGNPDYALSLKDLCLTSHLGELVDAGVTSLKIEGRMKRPEYVAAAANAYSAALDGQSPDLESLQAVFSRTGFTDGYITGRLGKEMFGYRIKEDVVSATPKLLKSLQNSYRGETGKIPVNMQFSCRKDKNCRLEISDSDGNRAVVFGELPEAALHRELTSEAAALSLSKLGGTIFRPGNITAEIEPGITLSSAALNSLRREGCQTLLQRRERTVPVPFNTTCLPVKLKTSSGNREALLFRGRFHRYEQLPLEQLDFFEAFSLPLEEVSAHTDVLLSLKDKILLEPARVLFGQEEKARALLQNLSLLGFRRVLCNNPAHLSLCRELNMTPEGGVYLNCTNSHTASELARLGVASQTLSFELALADAQRVDAPIPLGLVIYGWLPLMITRNCPVRRHFSCAECGGKKYLVDRKNIRFRILCTPGRYTEILNSAPLYLADRLTEFKKFSYGVLYFTSESREECTAIIDQYRFGASPNENFTRGLYYRNV